MGPPRAPASWGFLLLVHPIPCNLGPPLFPPVRCGYHVAFHCPHVAALENSLLSSGGQGGEAGPAHFGLEEGSMQFREIPVHWAGFLFGAGPMFGEGFRQCPYALASCLRP